MFACLLLYYISMFACLDLGFGMLCAFCRLVLVGISGHLLVWLHLSLLGFVWMWPLVRYTPVVLVCLIFTPFSTLCEVEWLPCFMLSVGLCLSVLGAICLRGCIHPSCGLLDVTTCETHLRDVDVLDTHLSLLRKMLSCLPHLLCATHLAFFASLHLCMLAYMFMHESVYLPYSNPIELWTLNPNLHLSS